MKKYLIFIFSIIVFSSFDNSPVLLSKSDTLTLLFAGDIMGHAPQFNAAYNPALKNFNYNVCFQSVKSYIQAVDIAIVNLEVPLAGQPYSGYPNFSSPDALLDGLKNAGYDVILTANNHVLDRNRKGLERTVNTIKNRNLLYAGSYLNKLQRDSIYPLIIDKKGFRIAILNCTYGSNENLPTFPNLVNYIDTIQIKEDVKKASNSNADLIIMTVHWGTEYHLIANDVQKKMAQFFANNGIHLIIGSHPHVVQNAEVIYGNDSMQVPVFYSLGNSISNQRNPNTDGGIMVKAEIVISSKKQIKTSYLPVYVHKGYLKGIFQYHLIPTSDYLSHPELFKLNKTDSLSLINFDNSTKKRLSNIDLIQ
jgi:poly-gamma-glutamate synthesis protein (capsule biosynthesis protein)